MSDHTPGPWRLGQARVCDHYTIGDRAPYIAAVPDLIAALSEIRISAVDADLRASTHRSALELIANKARAALAKAGVA